MPIAFQPIHPLSDTELERLSRLNPTVRFERGSRGELIVSPPVGTLGGFGEHEIVRQLDRWAEHRRDGLVLGANVGFTLPDGAVFAPDATWIACERWDALPPEAQEGFARIAPDVAFELLSPSDTLREAREKAAAYLRNGTRLVVLIEPRTRSVELHRSIGVTVAPPGSEHLALDPELPGFVLDIGAIASRMEKRSGKA